MSHIQERMPERMTHNTVWHQSSQSAWNVQVIQSHQSSQSVRIIKHAHTLATSVYEAYTQANTMYWLYLQTSMQSEEQS